MNLELLISLTAQTLAHAFPSLCSLQSADMQAKAWRHFIKRLGSHVQWSFLVGEQREHRWGPRWEAAVKPAGPRARAHGWRWLLVFHPAELLFMGQRRHPCLMKSSAMLEPGGCCLFLWSVALNLTDIAAMLCECSGAAAAAVLVDRSLHGKPISCPSDICAFAAAFWWELYT